MYSSIVSASSQKRSLPSREDPSASGAAPEPEMARVRTRRYWPGLTTGSFAPIAASAARVSSTEASALAPPSRPGRPAESTTRAPAGQGRDRGDGHRQAPHGKAAAPAAGGDARTCSPSEQAAAGPDEGDRVRAGHVGAEGGQRGEVEVVEVVEVVGQRDG
jgi:hypothetical protein